MGSAIGAIAVSTVVAGPASAAWMTAGGGPSRTNARLAIDVRPPLTARWSTLSHPMPGGLLEHAVTVAAGRVYGTTIDGGVFALSTGDGRHLWERDLRGIYATTPTYADGRVFVAPEHGTAHQRARGRLRALDAATGQTLWARWALSVPSVSEGAPLVVGRRVFITANPSPVDQRRTQARVVAFSVSGPRLWSKRLAGIAWQAPTWTGRYVVVADYAGWVYAFTRRGRLAWRTRVGAATYAATASSRRRIFVSSKDGVLRALSAATGRRLWARRVGWSPGYGEPAVTPRRIYVANLDGTVAAFTRRGGRVWRRRFGEHIYGAAVATRGVVWVSLHDTRQLLALASRTGRTLQPVASGYYDPAVASGNVVYLVGVARVTAVAQAP